VHCIGNKPENVKALLNLCALLFAAMISITYYLAIQYAANADLPTMIAGGATFIVYFLTGLLHGELGE
jgi:hypothetical protein